MRKTLKMKNLDCANCAAQIERKIKKIDGVNDASVSFMTQKMVLDVEEDKFDKVIEESKKICLKIDSDCEIIL